MAASFCLRNVGSWDEIGTRRINSENTMILPRISFDRAFAAGSVMMGFLPVDFPAYSWRPRGVVLLTVAGGQGEGVMMFEQSSYGSIALDAR